MSASVPDSNPPLAGRRIRDYFRRYRTSFGIGLLALIITQGFALTVPQLLRIATDAIVSGTHDRVLDAALGLFAVAVLGSLARIASRILIFNAGRKVEYDIRNDVFAHLTRLDPAFYHRMPLGQVMSRMVNDLTQVRLLLGPGVLNLTNTGLVYIVVIPLLFMSDPWLALFSLLPLPVLVLLGRFFAKRMYTLSRDAQDKLATLSAKVQENLSGVMTVRAYRQEPSERETFLGLNDDYLGTNMDLARLRGVMFPLMGMAGAIGSVVVLWIGGHRIVAGRMTVGGFVEFSAYLAALTWPTIALGWMISLWQRGIAAMDRVNEIFEAEPSVRGGTQTPPAYEGRIELRDLSFTYPQGRKPAVAQVNTTILPGQMIVIVGRTGSGKSTLLKVLARLLDVPRGQVLFDGVDVADLPLSHVRDGLGYAPQEAFLFSRTLHENIAFGAPEADLDRIWRAVEVASFRSDVEAFPEKLETMVGERGVTLSGGQRQRVTLARAIITDPRILILDDTLSAVDTETETRILDELTSAKAGRTLIMATHRLACAAMADRILVLEDGALVEQGTEAELLKLGGIYTAMHRRQRLREALEQVSHDLDPAGATV